VHRQCRSARQKSPDGEQLWIHFTKSRHAEQNSSRRSEYRVDRIPATVQPRHFVREKLDDHQHPGDGEHPVVSDYRQSLVCGGQLDPVETDRQTRDKRGEIEIDPSQGSQAKSCSQMLENFHDSGRSLNSSSYAPKKVKSAHKKGVAKRRLSVNCF